MLKYTYEWLAGRKDRSNSSLDKNHIHVDDGVTVASR